MIRDKIVIEDTTLRDGEQAPSVSFSMDDKLQIAKMVSDILSEDDSIDAGFPAISENESEIVSEICKNIEKNYILGLSRLRKDDIDKAYSSMHYTSKRKIGLIIPTSKIHLENKLNITPDELIERAISCINYSQQYFDDVEVGFEDASRTDIEYLCKITEEIIKAGAKSITIADTLGYWLPHEAKFCIEQIINEVSNISELNYLGVHCHNDLGLALANSIEALKAGANKIGSSFNGLGERAGNTSTEQILVLQQVKRLESRNQNIGKYKYDKIWECSRLVEKLSGIDVQKNSPIIGGNCYVHESGIHQDGILKDRSTYQLFDPALVGYKGDIFYYGKHSGKSGLKFKLQQLGINIEEVNMDQYYQNFMILCNTKKQLTDKDFIDIL
ncbi:MAG: 2-isopropylmalate synthase [Lachnospiraceae bacterium]|nr:2-isopropylmalate synthase [Lachnospiraceae bacterium]